MERLTREGKKTEVRFIRGVGRKERAGGFKSKSPKSAKSRTLANWWPGRSQTARATKIGRVNEREESI